MITNSTPSSYRQQASTEAEQLVHQVITFLSHPENADVSDEQLVATSVRILRSADDWAIS